MYKIGPSVIAIAVLVSAMNRAYTADHKHPPQNEHCVKACHDCQQLCDQCAAHCARLVADGKKDHFETWQTCQDCSDVCSAAASIVGRGGPFADLICMSCSDACKRCAEMCAKSSDDPMMKKCADECKKCEKACLEMLKPATSK